MARGSGPGPEDREQGPIVWASSRRAPRASDQPVQLPAGSLSWLQARLRRGVGGSASGRPAVGRPAVRMPALGPPRPASLTTLPPVAPGARSPLAGPAVSSLWSCPSCLAAAGGPPALQGGPELERGRARGPSGGGAPSLHVPWELPSALPSAPRLAQGPVPLDQNDLSGGQLSPRGSLGGRRRLGPVIRQKTEAGGHTASGNPSLSLAASPAAHAATGPLHRAAVATCAQPQPGNRSWSASLAPPSLLPWSSGLRVHARSGALEVFSAPRLPAPGSNDRREPQGFCSGWGTLLRLQSSSLLRGEPPTGRVPAHIPQHGPLA